MGKAADNEKRELRATYYNNVSVGLTVAGYVIPMLGLGSESLQRLREMATWNGWIISAENDKKILAIFTAGLISLFFAGICRFTANSIASKIED